MHGIFDAQFVPHVDPSHYSTHHVATYHHAGPYHHSHYSHNHTHHQHQIVHTTQQHSTWSNNNMTLAAWYFAQENNTKRANMSAPAKSQPKKQAITLRQVNSNTQPVTPSQVNGSTQANTTVTIREPKWNNQSEFEKAAVYFRNQLQFMQLKASKLAKRGFHKATEVATELEQGLKRELELYLKDPSNKDKYNTFVNTSEALIKQARPELEKHRGWKRVLANIALAIAGLGVFYLIAGLAKKAMTGSFLFFNKTDSSKILDALENTLQALPSPR